MTILVACDSFKDALDAPSVCHAISKGLSLANPTLQTITLPLADGGEGTAQVLTHLTNGRLHSAMVQDPIGRSISASFGISADGQTAFIDMAEASGLQRLSITERNPLQTSTYGTGQLILAALDAGAERIVLGIGGSATNDGGMGMARALGWQFLDANNRPLMGLGQDLHQIRQVVIPPTSFSCEIQVLCDVDNPLYGPRGAAHVYGAQKGANEANIIVLDQGLQHLASFFPLEHASLAGGGAAGGLGFGAVAFLGATLRSGIETILDYAKFEEHLTECDWVITGEGKIDDQTAQGKLISGVCAAAAKHHKPVIGLCGALLANPEQIAQIGLQSAFSICHHPTSLDKALTETHHQLVRTAYSVARLLS